MSKEAVVVINEVLEEVNLFEEETVGNIEPVAPEVTEEAEDATTPAFVMPAKFEGKSLEDIVGSYVNLERDHGRKSNEVGELRKLTDQILQNQVEAGKPAVPTPEVEEVQVEDFYADPKAAVAKALENNPRLQALEATQANETQAKAMEAMKARHSDAADIVVTPEFQEWVTANPTRQTMFAEAHRKYDVNMASDILDMYKAQAVDTEAAKAEATAARDAKAKDGLKNATSEKGAHVAPVKKIFKRAELIRMKIHDRPRYSSMEKEIQLAYAEGRVR